MSHDYRKYLVGQGVIGAGINFLLNGAIGWMLYRHLAHIPLYGRQSIAGDIVVTSLLLPMLVCLIATPLIRSEVRKARLPAASWDLWSVALTGGAPRLRIHFNDPATAFGRGNFALSGDRLYFSLEKRESDIWTAEVLTGQ